MTSAAKAEAPYRRIASEIRDRIRRGDFAVGERVPSARQITQQWGVAIATATKALAMLHQEGLVRAVSGVGTVVQAPAQAAAPPVAERPVAEPSVAEPSVPGPSVAEPSAATLSGVGPAPARPLPTEIPPVAEADPDGPSRAPIRRRRDLRPPERELTLDRIVHTGIAIADAEGLPALSMRRIAGELNVATMALYRYVTGKDELVLLMSDAVFGEASFPDRMPEGWRAQLELVARLEWAFYRRHPWMARVISLTRPMPAPNGMVHTDRAMGAVDGLGLDLSTMLHIAVTLAGFVHGVAVHLDIEAEAEQDTGMTRDQWMQRYDGTYADVIESGRFPMLARISQQPGVDVELDSVFELGLTLLLDGLAVLIERAGSDRTT